jgi:type IV fimbrial biogenesis protein FimT
MQAELPWGNMSNPMLSYLYYCNTCERLNNNLESPTAMSSSRHLPPPAASRASGFTLVELVVVMTIAAIVLGVGAPSFANMLAKYRIDAQHLGLMDNMTLAREEARNGGNPTTVCASSNGSSCTASAWNAGHIVFRDGGAKGTVDSGDTVLRYAQAAASGITVAATMQASGGAYGKTYVYFEADGKVDSSGAILFSTCKAGQPPLLMTVQRNGYIVAAKGASPC